MAKKATVQEELNLDKKVTVRSLADWITGFERKYDGNGDITIAANGTTRLSRNEIISQAQSGNRLFCGTDGMGSHATLYIDDAPTRIELGYESEDGTVKQAILTDEKVRELFDLKNNTVFEASFKEAVVTRAEKKTVMEIIKKLKLNDYAKIRFAEKYTNHGLA